MMIVGGDRMNRADGGGAVALGSLKVDYVDSSLYPFQF
jgi:hypothetical protein